MPLAITPIATATVSGSSTQNIYFNSIPQTFTNLIIYGYGTGVIGNNFSGDMQFNGSSSSYQFQSLTTQGTANSSRNISTSDRMFIDGNHVPWNGDYRLGMFRATIFNYSNSNTHPTINMQMSGITGDTAQGYFEGYGIWTGGTGVNSIRIFTSFQGANMFRDGTRFMLFGVN